MASIPKVALLIESSRASGRALLKGVANFVHHHQPWSFFWEPGGLEEAWSRLTSLEPDGVILRDSQRLDEVLALGIPVVVVGHRRPEVAGQVNVVTDSEAIGRLGAEHLLGCGFKHFAYCGLQTAAQETTTWSRDREEAFCRRVARAGFSCATHTVCLAGEGSWSQERGTLVDWLRGLPKPCGLMACNDDTGKEVIEACKLGGVAVPGDMAVVGADNDELVCGLSAPSLSSVAVNFERAGYEAARVLGELMRGAKEAPARITAQASHVVHRCSTDRMAVEDPHLGRAVRFIRNHADANVSVADAVRAAGLSRRALEKRFRVLLGHSVLDEIRRVRTEQICRLLVETNLPVARIAEQLGFDGPQHVARYFRALKGQTPLAYRQAHTVAARAS